MQYVVNSARLKNKAKSLMMLHLYSSTLRIEKEGLTERAIILCKLNNSLLESSVSVGIHLVYIGKKVCIT